MNRAKGEFEEKLLELRRQLEEERLRQAKTASVISKEEYSRGIMDLGTNQDVGMEELRRGNSNLDFSMLLD